MLRYAVTILLSAFLLFQVQPLIGKFILPWFGGTPAVWTTCMLFFQVVLLLGYSYAHGLARFPPRKAQALIHALLLFASLLLLPVGPAAESWKPTGDEMPIGSILALLSVTIGLPYFLLSSTGPLLQEGFRRETGRTPYRLYALSNMGSLLALVTYPFLFEPQLTLHHQLVGWSAGYGLFVPLCAWCAWGLARPSVAPAVNEERLPFEGAESGRPTARAVGLWLALAICGSAMLLATTNQLCLEVSSVPFLWVLPLAIYLLTFIICFDGERWYHRGLFLVLLAAAVITACFALLQGNQMALWLQVLIYSGTLFVCCMVCHGELAQSKPEPRYATLFYLVLAAGGAMGGVLVALVAPLLLHDFIEYPAGLVATVFLAFISTALRRKSTSPAMLWLAGGATCVALGAAIGMGVNAAAGFGDQRNLETTRNFYGVLRVNYENTYYDDNDPKHELINGRIQHGYQYLDGDKQDWATTYYGPPSGVGLALKHHPRRAAGEPLRIGVVGLGCGTLAAYGKAGDTVRFYEINPEVIRIADEYFTYCKRSPANIEIVPGDARIMLERESKQHYDVLVVDAFSSDAIPMHLLTRECVELFLSHLNPDGLLCVHISNRYLELEKVVAGIAESLDSKCAFIDSLDDKSLGLSQATWGIVTRNAAFFDVPQVKTALAQSNKYEGPHVIWTDDYGSLWQVLKW
jgi:hypothetical protein